MNAMSRNSQLVRFCRSVLRVKELGDWLFIAVVVVVIAVGLVGWGANSIWQLINHR